MEIELLKPKVGVSKPVSRKSILDFENALRNNSEAFFGDTEICPLKHSFCEGMYVREIFIPAGTNLTGKIHKHDHPNFLLKGEVTIATEGGGVQNLIAPLSMISLAGTKRALYCKTDTVWVTVHLNPKNSTDVPELEKDIIAGSFTELDEWLSNRKRIGAGNKETTNCGLLALSNLTDFKNISVNTLISLAADNGIKLSAYRVPLDKISSITLPVIAHTDNHFVYVSDSEQLSSGLKFTGVILSANELPFEKDSALKAITGGTFVAVGVGAATAGATIFGSIKNKQAAQATADAERVAAEEATKVAQIQAAAASKQLELEKYKAEHPTPVLLYVGIGVGGLALIGIIIWLVTGNKDSVKGK